MDYISDLLSNNCYICVSLRHLHLAFATNNSKEPFKQYNLTLNEKGCHESTQRRSRHRHGQGEGSKATYTKLWST